MPFIIATIAVIFIFWIFESWIRITLMLSAVIIVIAITIQLEKLRPACGECGSKRGSRWAFQRVDGGPDRRHNNNHLVCIECLKRWRPITKKNE
jgi:hypothetical protein